ncbi:hypothetical protein [Muricoccus aerilatus]|uniref:hypothetical protein n=1 Tax=Muricoccus aerilatus TaxID=452982 RepID=UPI000693D6D4|nr:hypothetical protein [Roseomonas aerilata]
MDFLLTRTPRQPLRAHGVLGATSGPEWDAAAAEPVAWEDLFALSGIFGVEIGAAAAQAGEIVEMHGYMTPPMLPEADYFVLSQGPMPDCPFCAPSLSWPDDIVVVHLRAAGVDIDHPMRPVTVRGRLSLGEEPGPVPGLSSHARLLDAIWQPGEAPNPPTA